MRKYLLFSSLLLSSMVSFGFNSNEFASENTSSLNAMPTVTPTPAKTVEAPAKVVLDKYAVCHPCEPGVRPRVDSDCDTNMVIAVSAGKAEDAQLKYEYTVSGGRVIGKGARVVWDVTGAMPGTYQIEINAEDKSGGRKWKETKTITVSGSNCGCGLCVCPTIEVNAPKSPASASEIITFTANVSGGGSGESITYNWVISDGVMVEGQGTPVIRVATDSKMAGKKIKATVEIGGICEECPKTESAEILIVPAKPDKK